MEGFDLKTVFGYIDEKSNRESGCRGLNNGLLFEEGR